MWFLFDKLALHCALLWSVDTAMSSTKTVEPIEVPFHGGLQELCIGWGHDPDFSFFFSGQRTKSHPPLLSSPPSHPFRSKPPLNTVRGAGGTQQAPPVGSGVKTQPTNNLVHIGVKKCFDAVGWAAGRASGL